jgi:hypothetical protein
MFSIAFFSSPNPDFAANLSTQQPQIPDFRPHNFDLRFLGSGESQVQIPRGQICRTDALVLKNMSADKVVNLRVSTDAVPDLSSMDRILNYVRSTATDQSTASLAESAWKMVRAYRYSYQSATDDDECHDPVKLLNVYGYGLCDDSARVLATIWNQLGFPVQLWELKWHCVSEYEDHGKWSMLDADLQMFAPRPGNGLPASVPEIQQHSNWLKYAPGHQDSRSALALVRKTYHNRATESFVCKRHDSIGHEIVYELFPGEEATRYRESNLGYFSTIDPNPPPQYANTVFTWQPDVHTSQWNAFQAENTSETVAQSAADSATAKYDFIIHKKLPFILVGGEVRLQYDSRYSGTVTVSFVRNGTLERPATIREDILREDNCRTLALEIPREIRGAYDFDIVIRSSENPVRMLNYQQTLITQCSPTLFPRLQATGYTTFRLESDTSSPALTRYICSLADAEMLPSKSSERSKLIR